MVSEKERMFAAAIYVISFFTVLIGPIIIWLIKKDDSEYIDYHGKQYLNFLISFFIYNMISIVLVLVLVGILLLFILNIIAFILIIIAAVKAYDGERYKIPFVIPFLR